MLMSYALPKSYANVVWLCRMLLTGVDGILES